MDKKAQTWKLMENLRSERILNGVENLDSLSASLSQSLWSISSLSNNKKSDYMTDSVISKRASTPSLGLHSTVIKSNSSDNSSCPVRGKSRKFRYKNFRSLTGSVDLTNIQLLNLQRTTSLEGSSQDLCGSHDGNHTAITGSKLLDHSYCASPNETKGNCTSGHLSCHDDHSLHARSHLMQRFPTSDASSTEDSEESFEDDSSRDTGVARLEASTGHESLTLPRLGKSRKYAFVLNKSASHSPLDLNESFKDFRGFDSSIKDIGSQSFPESSNPLKSILRLFPRSKRTTKKLAISRTKSNGDAEHTKKVTSPPVRSSCTTPVNAASTDSISTDDSKIMNRNEWVRKGTVRHKCHSVGSLEAPDIRKLLPGITEGCTPRGNGINSLSQHLYHENSPSLVRSRSCSEGSLFIPPSDTSSFNVVYVRDMVYSRSQKPNVETVDEEEESQTKTKNNSMEEPETKDEIEKSLSSSDCTEIMQKSSDENEAETDHVLTSCDKREVEQECELISGRKNNVENEDLLKSDDESGLESQRSTGECEVTRNPSPVKVVNKTSHGVAETLHVAESLHGVVCSEENAVLSKSKELFREMKEICSLSESDSEVELEPTMPDRYQLIPGWQPLKTASVESDNYLSSPASLDDINIVLTEKDDDQLSDESTATLENASRTPTPDEGDDGLCTSMEDASTFLAELLSPVKKKSHTTIKPFFSPTERSVTTSPSRERKLNLLNTLPKPKKSSKTKLKDNNIFQKKVKELSKMFEPPPQETHTLTTSQSLRGSKENLAATTASEASMNCTSEDKSKKTTLSPGHKPLRRISPGHRTVPVVTKDQPEAKKPLVGQKRKESLSKIPVANERRKSLAVNGIVRKESRNKLQPLESATADTIPSLERHSSTSPKSCHSQPADKSTCQPTPPASVKVTTKAEHTRIPRASCIPEPKAKPCTTKLSPSSQPRLQRLNGNRFYRQLSGNSTATRSAVNLLSNSNENNNTSGAQKVELTPLNTSSLISFSELELKSVMDARKGDNQAPCATDRTIFRPKRQYSNRDFEKCSTHAPSFGFHRKLKHHHSFDQIDVVSPSVSPLSASTTKQSPVFKSPREWQNFGSKSKFHSTEQLSGHKWKQIK